MKAILSNIVIFSAGLAIGSAVTWQFFKTKYEKLAQEEIESVKEVYSRKFKKVEPKSEPVEKTDDRVEVPEKDPTSGIRDEYEDTLRRLGYTNYSDIPKSSGKEEASVDRPYVISPEEYGDIEEYEQIELTYYEDGVLTDDQDEPIDDVDDIVGSDFATHFGEHEEDSVHIRNDSHKCDYEILQDPRRFADLHRADS